MLTGRESHTSLVKMNFKFDKLLTAGMAVALGTSALTANPVQASGATCWFQMTTGAQRMKAHNCRVYDRINTNGHRVYDVIERNGLTRTIVLWDNQDVEVILNGRVYRGVWGVDVDRDVQVTVAGGTFAFRLPPHIRSSDSPTTTQVTSLRPTLGQTMSDTPFYWKK